MGNYTCPNASTAKDTYPYVQSIPYSLLRLFRCKNGHDLTEIALLEYANKHSLAATQVPPDGISDALPPSFQDESTNNVLVTASFGHIIPNPFLGHFEPNKRLNVHPSLLPKYRGAAPIQWTIANADTSTGVSVQRLVERGKGIDGGDIVGAVDGLVSIIIAVNDMMELI